jgi:sugar lactone lactonase YvrE
MKTQDLKMQIFQTASQWQSGLLFRLEALQPAGITLFSRPQFVRWLRTFAPGAERADSLVLDECAQVYWVDGVSGWLYRFDPRNAQQERMLHMGGYTSHSGRMVLNDRTLWLVDRSQQRILAFSREHLQLQYVLENGAIDLAFDGGQYLYVLEKNHQGAFYIGKYDVNGLRATEAVFQPEFHDPQGVAVGKASQLYVIDTDAYGSRGFHRIAGDSSEWIAFPKALQSLTPTLMAIDARGNIFVVVTEATPTAHADSDTEELSPLHQFSPDASYLGQVNIPNSVRTIHSIAFDAHNAVYLGTEQGLAYLDVQTNLVGQTGVYYSRTLDNGAKQGQWHRLRLQADLPPGTSIEVQYYASDDDALQSAIDCLLSNPSLGQQEKERRITRWLGSRWSAGEVFTGSRGSDQTPSGGDTGTTENSLPSSLQTLHLLFQEHVGRYLWLKLALSTFDEQYKPAVSGMQVYSPRLSYLRFLPAIYQEDAVSSAFLEKFLALFETVFHGFDTEIHQTFNISIRKSYRVSFWTGCRPG